MTMVFSLRCSSVDSVYWALCSLFFLFLSHTNYQLMTTEGNWNLNYMIINRFNNTLHEVFTLMS